MHVSSVIVEYLNHLTVSFSFTSDIIENYAGYFWRSLSTNLLVITAMSMKSHILFLYNSPCLIRLWNCTTQRTLDTV